MGIWLRDVIFCLIFLVISSFFITKGALSSGYNWQWDLALPYFFRFSENGTFLGFGPLIANGLVCTLQISVLSLFFTYLLGLITAILRIIGGPFTKGVCFFYIHLFRNTPLMVQLIAMYLIIPASWGLSSLSVAILTLTLFEGAYMAEILRAGIISIPNSQWEAALSLGLPYRLCWQKIILPQALRKSLPPVVNQSVSLVKDSSLASVIAVSELSQQSNIAVSDSFLAFEIWLPVAGIYLCLALTLSGIAGLLKRRLSY